MVARTVKYLIFFTVSSLVLLSAVLKGYTAMLLPYSLTLLFIGLMLGAHIPLITEKDKQ